MQLEKGWDEDMMTIVWIALIIVFAAVEMATVGLTSIWFAGGALAALIVCAVGLSEVWQFAAFVVVSLILLIFTRPLVLKYFKPRLVKTNYEQIIEDNVCVTETIDNLHETGVAVYKGQEWTARACDDRQIFEAGTIVKVKEVRGVTLYVVESDIMPRKENTSEQM